MNTIPKHLIAFSLFVALFAKPAVSQQVQFTLVQVKKGEMHLPAESNTKLVEQRFTVQVPYTENVTQNYTVQVPYTEKVNQKYTVEVPYTEIVIGADGKEKEVQKSRTEQREREVVMNGMKNETKTRVVPVTRMRAESRIRRVPIHRRGDTEKTLPFPPTDAKFTYVSGEEISNKKLKDLASESLTILQLQAGETLSDLHRQVLKPDLIVMTLQSETQKDPQSEK